MKRTYKIAALILAALSVLSVAVEFLLMKKQEADAVTIIGGADGPTAIFVAGKTGGEPFYMIAVILIAAAAAVLILSRKKK